MTCALSCTPLVEAAGPIMYNLDRVPNQERNESQIESIKIHNQAMFKFAEIEQVRRQIYHFILLISQRQNFTWH